jgi:hypothetical protein
VHTCFEGGCDESNAAGELGMQVSVPRMTLYDPVSNSCVRTVLVLRKRIESLLRGIGPSANFKELGIRGG